MSQRYPDRKYIPFARRDDCDDIACFEYGKGDAVFIVHDYASAGFEEHKRYDNIWGWFKDAIDELTIDENGHCKYLETWIFCSDGSGEYPKGGKTIFYSDKKERGGSDHGFHRA